MDGKHVIRQKGPVSAASGSKSDGAASSSGVTVAAVDYNIGQWQVQGAKEHQQHAAAGGNRAGQSPGDAGLWVWDGTRREQSSPAGQDSALYPQLWDGGGGSGSGNYAPTASLAAVYPPPRQRRLDVLLFRMIRQPQEPLCRADFVRAMMEHVQLADPNHMELVVFGGWFGRVPQRLGRVIHLDSAACAFVLHLLGKMRGDANLVAASRSVYGRSLVALQRALNHPVEWRSPETLCTAFLLCLFEVGVFSAFWGPWPQTPPPPNSLLGALFARSEGSGW